MSKIIIATNNREILVSDEDFEKLNSFKWYVDDHGKLEYARITDNRLGKRFGFRMHQWILEGKGIRDHINGNGLDNRRTNLRICSSQNNTMNRGKNSNNTTGSKGVTFDKSRGKFKAQIKLNRRNLFLGRFEDIESASEAYEMASKKYFGEFKRDVPL